MARGEIYYCQFCGGGHGIRPSRVPDDCPTLRRQRRLSEEEQGEARQIEQRLHAQIKEQGAPMSDYTRHTQDAAAAVQREREVGKALAVLREVVADHREAAARERGARLDADLTEYHRQQEKAREAQTGAALVRRLSRKFLPGMWGRALVCDAH